MRRPSEAIVLRRGKLDLTNGRAMIVRSRHLGVEDAPKNARQQANRQAIAERCGTSEDH